MPGKLEDFDIVARYVVRGVGRKEGVVHLKDISYEDAGRRASRVAKALDDVYGDDHFWTVDLYKPDREHGSFYQLFHGRLS